MDSILYIYHQSSNAIIPKRYNQLESYQKQVASILSVGNPRRETRVAFWALIHSVYSGDNFDEICADIEKNSIYPVDEINAFRIFRGSMYLSVVHPSQTQEILSNLKKIRRKNSQFD